MPSHPVKTVASVAPMLISLAAAARFFVLVLFLFISPKWLPAFVATERNTGRFLGTKLGRSLARWMCEIPALKTQRFSCIARLKDKAGISELNRASLCSTAFFVWE